MVSSGEAKGCTLTDLSSEKSIQWITTNCSGNCKEEILLLSLTSSSHLSSKRKSSHKQAWETEAFQQDSAGGLCSCARQLPGHGSNTPWNPHSSTLPALGQKPGSRLPHAALCSYLSTPSIAGTHEDGGQGHLGAALSPTVLRCWSLVGQSCRGTVWRGKERREDLTKHLQITPANCALPGVHNNSTQNPSCHRAPPGCLQRARFSGRRGWGVANNYTELEGSDLKRIFLEREINTFNSEQEHSAHNPFTSWQGRTAEACYEACLNNSIFIFWISN